MNSSKKQWWATEFRHEYLTTLQYKTSHQKTLKETAFITRSLHLRTRDIILDLGCGYGRHTIALAKRGYNIIGLDYSQELLKQAILDAKRSGANPAFIQGDMRKITYKNAFSVILCIFTSFGYFSQRENQMMLRKIYHALSSHGSFFLDILNGDMFMQEMKQKGIRQNKNTYIKSNIYRKNQLTFYNIHTLNMRTQIDHLKRTWNKGKIKGEYHLYIKRYTIGQLIHMLETEGFYVVRTWGDYTGSPWTTTSPRTIIFATKNAWSRLLYLSLTIIESVVRKITKPAISL